MKGEQSVKSWGWRRECGVGEPWLQMGTGQRGAPPAEHLPCCWSTPEEQGPVTNATTALRLRPHLRIQTGRLDTAEAPLSLCSVRDTPTTTAVLSPRQLLALSRPAVPQR